MITGDITKLLSENSYPGRGIIIGKTPDGSKAVTAYFIMGRSENSRNRIFIDEGINVKIMPDDITKVEDPSLIIYSPLRVCKDMLIVTNGDQTDTIFDYISSGSSFEQALESRDFEPDKPNYTPRISGILYFTGGYRYKMSILKANDEHGSGCNRYTFSYTPVSGIGHFIHTYDCDGAPLPSFTGEPERISLCDDIDEFTESLWNNLDKNNRISLYVRYVSLADGSFDNRMKNIHKGDK